MARDKKGGLRARLSQLLDSNPDVTPEQAVEALKGEGLGDAARIRKNFYNLRSERKTGAGSKAAATASPKSKPAQAKKPKAGGGGRAALAAVRGAESKATTVAAGQAAPASEAVRQLEEVIRRCGGIEAVRQLLDVLERIGTR
jgi:hypothetical protein